MHIWRTPDMNMEHDSAEYECGAAGVSASHGDSGFHILLHSETTAFDDVLAQEQLCTFGALRT